MKTEEEGGKRQLGRGYRWGFSINELCHKEECMCISDGSVLVFDRHFTPLKSTCIYTAAAQTQSLLDTPQDV